MLKLPAEAAEHLHLSLRSATKLGSRSLTLQATTLLALISDVLGLSERDQLAERWGAAKVGDADDMSRRREQVRRVGEIVKLLGVRVAEGWR